MRCATPEHKLKPLKHCRPGLGRERLEYQLCFRQTGLQFSRSIIAPNGGEKKSIFELGGEIDWPFRTLNRTNVVDIHTSCAIDRNMDAQTRAWKPYIPTLRSP